MFVVNILELFLKFEPLLYIFGAFGFYGCMLCLQKMILGKGEKKVVVI